MSCPRIGSETPNGTACQNCSHGSHSVPATSPIMNETTRHAMPVRRRKCSRRTIAGMVQPAMVRREHLRRLTGIACLVVSFMMGLVAGTEWLPWLQFWHAVPFGVSDPILGHDIGFYVFRLPMLEMADQFAMTLLIFSFIGSSAAYVLAGALNFTRRGGVSVAG